MQNAEFKPNTLEQVRDIHAPDRCPRHSDYFAGYDHGLTWAVDYLSSKKPATPEELEECLQDLEEFAEHFETILNEMLEVA